MIRYLHLLLAFLLLATILQAQPCNPSGNQTTFGNNNNWRAYVYDNMDFTNYRGFFTINGGGNPNFDHNFGGSDGSFSVGSCSVDRNTFSVRFKLRRNFTAGGYRFTIGGDDGYRFSVDGGLTWIINQWHDQSYSISTYDIFLSGSTDLVLEYYENGGDNRVSFDVSAICMGTEDTNVYGTNNIWNAYVYDGTNFQTYAGRLQVGSAASPNFDQNFGGSNVTLNTSSCATTTETFSVRYRLRKTFDAGTYQFTVGADDGYRFSLDGGASWLIDNWNEHSYTSSISPAISLSGEYDMVVEYFENGGENRVSFEMATISLLPIYLTDFKASLKNQEPTLKWSVTANSTPDYFEVERSVDGRSFRSIGIVTPGDGQFKTRFTFTDKTASGNRVYYRLKMVDIDRTATYSKTLTVNINGSESDQVQVYPSIVTGHQVQVKSSAAYQSAAVTVADLTGRILIRQTIGQHSANQPKSIDLSALKGGKGVYLLRFTTGDGVDQTRKIILP